jgi:hypothetical protein
MRWNLVRKRHDTHNERVGKEGHSEEQGKAEDDEDDEKGPADRLPDD